MKNTKEHSFYFIANAPTLVFPDLSDSTIARIFYLVSFVNSKGYLTTKSNHSIAERHISKVCQISVGEYYKFRTDVIETGLLSFEDNKIYPNPLNFGFAAPNYEWSLEPGEEIFTLYSNPVRQIYESLNTRSLKCYGKLLRLIPFMNSSNNVLCYDPHEWNDNYIKVIDDKGVQQILDCHPKYKNTLIHDITSLSFNHDGQNMQALYMLGDTRKRNVPVVFCVNPYLCCNEPIVAVERNQRKLLKHLFGDNLQQYIPTNFYMKV